jgi:ABC-type phosphate/phosphonate transport system substrate-binding protein
MASHGSISQAFGNSFPGTHILPLQTVMCMLRSLLRLFLFLLFVPCTTVSAHPPLKVGVAPNDAGSVALAKHWVPFLKQLEVSSGLVFRFATAPDLLEFHQRMEMEAYDLVVTDSYLYTIFKQKHALQFMAELGPQVRDDEVVLVCHPDISTIDQLDGSLLAVIRGESNSNLQLLDEFLTHKGVTVLRDGLTSGEKVLSSIEEKVHLAGLVPLHLVKQHGQSLKIIWQASNQDHYLLSANSSLNSDIQGRLNHALEQLMLRGETNTQADVAVFSVRKEQ